jgi:hypothetical protein
MATHADVAPADLDIFMLHFMLSAFRFFSKGLSRILAISSDITLFVWSVVEF